MKFLFAILLSMSFYGISAQNSTFVSLNGIGDIKLGMKKSEVEKLTGQKIRIVNLLRGDDWLRDTVEVFYKSVAYELVFDKDYESDGVEFIVCEIQSRNRQLKTKSGIGIGDDKMKIINTYKDYLIQVMPAYEGLDNPVRSKTKSIVWLYGDSTNAVIIFYLEKNKVTGFCVTFNEGC